MSVSISKSMTTSQFAGSPPRPAPRKSLARNENYFSNNNNNNTSTINSEKRNSIKMEEKFSLVKLHASKFQRALIENNIEQSQNTKLIKYRIKPTHTSTNYTNTLTKFKTGFGQHKNAENSKKESDEVLASSRQQVVNTSGDDELDDSSTDDTEDSADNANRPPKPGRLDLRQFDNITTAIGKLNVSTAATTITTSSSPLVSSSHTTNPTSSMNIKSSIETTTPNNNNNARRLQKNPRQNHGRAVAPPKLPPTSNLLEADNNDKMPANDQVAQLSNQEDNSAIDFSQSPIAQRLLKHSKDHKGKCVELAILFNSLQLVSFHCVAYI